MPRRIVVNTCFGGFGLSEEAKEMYLSLTRDKIERPLAWCIELDVARDDPNLLKVIDTLGLNPSAGSFSQLAIVEIPDDVPEDGWIIQEYDGKEWVAEKHRKWFPE
jgi:hypothetical protein